MRKNNEKSEDGIEKRTSDERRREKKKQQRERSQGREQNSKGISLLVLGLSLSLSLCRFGSHAGRALAFPCALHRRLRARPFSLLSSAESETERKRVGRRRERVFQKKKSETDVPVTDSMPPQQRYLPSAWDRGGLLGPRGNARFLEVDGLRVKYIGMFFLERKENVVAVGGEGIKKTSPRWQMFFRFPSPLFARRCVPCLPWTALL